MSSVGVQRASTASIGSATKDICSICTKVVYPMDKAAADDKIYHKTCLRCGHCKKVLSLGNYAALNGVFYCKPHFKQLFAVKGNYSDGFRASEAANSNENSPSSGDAPVDEIDAIDAADDATEKGDESSFTTSGRVSAVTAQFSAIAKDNSIQETISENKGSNEEINAIEAEIETKKAELAELESRLAVLKST